MSRYDGESGYDGEKGADNRSEAARRFDALKGAQTRAARKEAMYICAGIALAYSAMLLLFMGVAS